MSTRKKLIEVALPLEAINKASAREKSIRHGHPSTLHLWWARRPLAAARAVIFSQMVDDPSEYVDVLKSDPKLLGKAKKELKAKHKVWQEARTLLEKAELAGVAAPAPGPEPTLDGILADLERQRLFKIIEDLVLWENTTNETVLQAARDEIWASWRRTCAENAGHTRAAELFDRQKLPAFHDPFAGGGALPLEAQRLGLEAYASDLNPVAVLINKAMIEIPPKFAGRPPVHPPAEPRESLDLCGKSHVFSNQWDNLTPGGSGSVDVWEYNGSFYVTTDGIDHSDDLEALEEDAGTEGPFSSFEIILEQEIGNIRSLGPASVSVSSQRHSATELRRLLKIEPCLLEGEEDLDEWKLTLNGVPHRAVVKTLNLESAAKEGAQAEMKLAGEWRGAQGLAEDVRYYGKWMRDEAEKRIGQLYPKIEITAAMAQERPDLKPLVGQALTVIAWLWARTVKSPNPAFRDVDVPLASTFMLSTKPGKEAYVEPVIEDGGYRFTVKVGKPKDAAAVKAGTKLARGANFQCVMSGIPIASEHIYAEANAGGMGARLMTIVAEGDRGRIYLPPTPEHEASAKKAKPEWKPDVAMPENPRWFSPPLFGLKTYGDIFTPRQMVTLTTLCDLVGETMERVRSDALAAGQSAEKKSLCEGGTGAAAYSEAVRVYLALAVDKATDYNTTLVAWSPTRDQAKSTFARQALPMVWDYTEVNQFAGAAGDFLVSLEGGIRFVETAVSSPSGVVSQADAATQTITRGKTVSTDPPYYDNIGYADLSDFFYVWMRRSLRGVFPDLFATLAVPKAEELVATPYRHGNREKAETFFLGGMTKAMHRLTEQAHPSFPVTIYYAFKQSESEGDGGTASTGWETFLDAVQRAGFGISGTWPMRTERGARSISIDTNALASSIILVCRPRAADAPTATRREFVAALQRELPEALRHLQAGNIAPVDLAQAAIGPGMAVFTRYAQVLDAQGKSLTVREALALINETLDTALAEQEGDFDPDSRWALAWFDQFGFAEGEYGVAETLSKAKNTSVQGLQEAGILDSARGKVRLLRPEELPAGWDPTKDPRLTHWETVHHLIRVLGGGESAAAELVAKLGAKAEPARELAYRLYTLCERKKRAAEALAYNGLVQSWPDLLRLAEEAPSVPVQGELL